MHTFADFAMPDARFYWDSNVFIALLQNERRAPGEMEGAKEVAAAADSGNAIIYTSAMTRGEVLEKAVPGVRDRFGKLFHRPNYVWLPATEGVFALVADLRQELRKLSTEDATHLASAMIARVDELHTFDTDDLIPLNGLAATRNLIIRKPGLRQTELDLG